jgi:hypothetical protein
MQALLIDVRLHDPRTLQTVDNFRGPKLGCGSSEALRRIGGPEHPWGKCGLGYQSSSPHNC